MHQNTQNQHLNTCAQNLQHPNLHNQEHMNTFTQNLQHTNAQNQQHTNTENQQKSGFVYRNYKFHLVKRRKRFINWRCANYRKTRCPAVFYTTLNFEPLIQKHQHISACEPVAPLDRTRKTSDGATSFPLSQSSSEDNCESLQSAIEREALKHGKQQKPTCEPDVSLDRTHSPPISEEVKSLAESISWKFESLQSAIEFITDSQILEREEKEVMSTSQSTLQEEGKESITDHKNQHTKNLQHPNLHNQQHPNTENQQKSSGFIYKNYKFHLVKRQKKNLYWRCANYRKTHCPAVFYMTLNFEPLVQKHQHISSCEPVSPLNRMLYQQTFEGVKSFAGSQSAFGDNSESVTEPQSPLDREGSQILEREEEEFISTSQSTQTEIENYG